MGRHMKPNKGRGRGRSTPRPAGKLVVLYDEDARKEYLTGFHKRKVERRKVAEERAAELEKEARREARAEVSGGGGGGCGGFGVPRACGMCAE